MSDDVNLDGAPMTAALVKRHQAETEALDNRFPDGPLATRHDWRHHSLRQARELLEHAAFLERRAPIPEGLPPEKHFGEVSSGGDSLDERMAYAEGWNDCRRAMQSMNNSTPEKQ